MSIKVKKLDPHVILPSYATPEASCFDIRSNENVTIKYGKTKLVKTGLVFDLDKGYELEIRQRSGLSIQYPNYINNAPGTIDSDFRGELLIIINNSNFEKLDFIIKKGDRIAQGKINFSSQHTLEEAETIRETKRGKGGFGSTGIY